MANDRLTLGRVVSSHQRHMKELQLPKILNSKLDNCEAVHNVWSTTLYETEKNVEWEKAEDATKQTSNEPTVVDSRIRYA